MKNVVIFGLGKIADVAYHHIVRDSQFNVLAFTVDSAWLTGTVGVEQTYHGRPIIPFEELQRHYAPDSTSMFVAIGYHELNTVRARKCAEAKAKGYDLVSYVSPQANTGGWLDIGENCLVLDGVGIQPGVRIGNNVSIWNNTLIGHHSEISDHCWLAAGATLGGGVKLGERSFVGLNATIGGEVSLGADCFIGAGCLVIKGAPDQSVFVERGTEKFRLDSKQFLRLTTMPAMGATNT